MVDELVQSSSLDALLPTLLSAHSLCLDLASSLHGYQVYIVQLLYTVQYLCQNTMYTLWQAVEIELIERSTAITKQFIHAAPSTTVEVCVECVMFVSMGSVVMSALSPLEKCSSSSLHPEAFHQVTHFLNLLKHLAGHSKSFSTLVCSYS